MSDGSTPGLTIDRRFTTAGGDPYDTIQWTRRDSKITNPDGSVVFEMKGAEIPASFSQVAADIMVSKYFRKAGVPQYDEHGEPITDFNGEHILGAEHSAKDLFNRLAETWRWWGENYGYFASSDDAQAFEDELKYMLANQMAAPNSPQWFNTGLHHNYGIAGTKQGFSYVDEADGEIKDSPDSYSRPAPHACFPAGTRVMTEDGFTPIEKIEQGDLVLTHEGHLRPVREIMQRQVEESLVHVTVQKLSATPLVATANHPILAVRNGVVSWIDAGDLRRGDHVVIASPDVDATVPDAFDLADGLGSNLDVDAETITTINAVHEPTMVRSLDISDPAVMRLIGRWLGDGSIGHDSRNGERASVNFVFDAGDTEGIEDVQDLMATFFGVSTEVEYANGQRTAHLRFTRRPLARWFGDTFGEGFARKALPSWVYSLPAAHRIQLLVGLYQSDGCIHRAGGFLDMNFDHSNQDLAEGIWRVARSLGYAPSISGGTMRPGGSTRHFRVQASAKDAPDLAQACGLDVPGTESQGRELRIDGLVAYRVTHVATEPFFGTVYNFQVEEDESYVANGIVVHNCFIQSVDDDLVNPGGIMDLWIREARLFKFGSGTGTNFSHIRSEGEQLAGGGKSSGLMSFLKIGDRAAGAIKSGGTTRRAAKMVILDIDHPDIEEFIAWKKVEEQKARILIEHGGFPADFNGEAYSTVSGQNSNNSVRVTNDFIQAVIDDGDWHLTTRTDGSIRKTIKARDLWRQIADAAWACADPGMQYHTTINEWHTSPAGGEIRASNPCSEYMFLDNTACNLASLNLVRFTDDNGVFDIAGYEHAIRVWTIVLEISVTMAQFPSREIAQGSFDYRTLGLGYANLGSLLMRSGIPYDSDEGRAIAGALTATLTGIAYAASAEMAAVRGPFPRFAENRDNMLRVMRNHRRAAYNETDFEGVGHQVMGVDPAMCPPNLLESARGAWDKALALGEAHGYRNAQATVLAPTGTIGLLMDCDTTGVEPDFALVKFKKLAGGGYFKIANQSIAPALRHLGYTEEQIDEIIDYVVGTSTLLGAPHVNRETLTEKGLTAEEIDKIEEALPSTFELKHAFNVFVVGEQALARLGYTPDEYTSFEFDLLSELGFTPGQVREANDYVCGHQTIEGAPHLADAHLPVFDCANRNGKYGERFIHHTGHIKMMAATQPFISGAISKTINMPNEVTVDEVAEAYMMSWELGIKAMALYRDGSKASQPLSASSDDGDNEELAEDVAEALQEDAMVAWGKIPAGLSPTEAYANTPRPRFLLPARRGGFTQEARVGGHKVFLRTGEYEDGTLGEIFIDLAKEGATLRGVLASFAIAVSKGLQYGVPLEEFVDTFVFQTFEPRGMVEGHPNIKMANSIIDYMFRALGVEYLHRDELVQVPPDRSESDLSAPPKGLAAEAGQQLELTGAAKETEIDAQAAAAAFADGDLPADPYAPISSPGGGGVPSGTEGASVSSPSGGGGARRASKGEMLSNGPGAMASQREKTAVTAAGSNYALTADLAAGELMGDAPACSNCGHMTVRNGSCYVCLTCGDTTGCS